MTRLISVISARAMTAALLILLAGCGDKSAAPVTGPAAAPAAPVREPLPLPPGVAEPVAPVPGAPDDGKRWIQKSLVGIGAKAKLETCVPVAIAAMPELRLDTAAAAPEPGTLTLYTSLAASYPGLIVTISPGAHDTADIQYIGHGFREPDAGRQAIAPQLHKLADAIGAACKG